MQHLETEQMNWILRSIKVRSDVGVWINHQELTLGFRTSISLIPLGWPVR